MNKLFSCHSGLAAESINSWDKMDSGFRRNDNIEHFLLFQQTPKLSSITLKDEFALLERFSESGAKF
jgi:hypothetical protein